MSYDASKDKELRKYDLELDGRNYIIYIVSYDSGPEKVAVGEKSRKDPSQIFPVKRMSIPLLLAVAGKVRANEPDQSDPFAEGGEG